MQHLQELGKILITHTRTHTQLSGDLEQMTNIISFFILHSALVIDMTCVRHVKPSVETKQKCPMIKEELMLTIINHMFLFPIHHDDTETLAGPPLSGMTFPV